MDLRFLKISVVRCLATLATLTLAQFASAQDVDPWEPFSNELLLSDFNASSSIYPNIPQFGGPSSVGGQLAEDNDVDVPQFRLQRLQQHFDPWYQFKARLNENHGLQFGIAETMLYQDSTTGGQDDSASGIIEVFGQWELLGRGTDNPGLLVFKGENRHRIETALTPQALGFAVGSAIPTGTKFNEFSFAVTNLYWKQYFFDRQLAVVVGRVDPTDFVDVYALINPLTAFTNLAFSTNPTIAAPNQGLGVAAGAMLTDRLYAQGGFTDANGQPTLAGFDTFFDVGEYFSYAELGITSSQDRIYLDNVHVTLWHTDARETAMVPEGRGVAFTAQKFVCDRWLPFFRFGYSDGDAALMETTFSTGVGLRRPNNDVAGIGVSWGRPSSGPVESQFTSEAFYRFQLTQFLALTPDVQLIVDPALNPGQDVVAFFGLRLRAAL
jgi:porin